MGTVVFILGLSILLIFSIIINNTSDFAKKFKLKNYKHRIIEVKKQNGSSVFKIQQQNRIFKNWHNCYRYSAYFTNDFTFDTFNEAKNKLQSLINEYEDSIIRKEGEKVIDIVVVASTEIIEKEK